MRASAPVVSRQEIHVSHYEPRGAAPASSSNPPLFNARRVRVQHIARAKAEGIPLTMLTAYDALTAPILGRWRRMLLDR